ncbi:MAG TPA: DUF4266 domain-containing protein [Cellvibrio sp.]|nr:DUF4266 domain-containing protein [Cellvibrio sp.]
MNRASKLLLISLTLLSAAACTPVKSWERGNLARPEMSFTPDPLARQIQDHIYHSKEGSSSVVAGSGGGCGCN